MSGFISYIFNWIGESIWNEGHVYWIYDNNVSLQGNNVKVKLILLVERIWRDYGSNFLGNYWQSTKILLVLSEAFLQTYGTPNMKCLAKIVNGWIQ